MYVPLHVFRARRRQRCNLREGARRRIDGGVAQPVDDEGHRRIVHGCTILEHLLCQLCGILVLPAAHEGAQQCVYGQPGRCYAAEWDRRAFNFDEEAPDGLGGEYPVWTELCVAERLHDYQGIRWVALLNRQLYGPSAAQTGSGGPRRTGEELAVALDLSIRLDADNNMPIGPVFALLEKTGDDSLQESLENEQRRVDAHQRQAAGGGWW